MTKAIITSSIVPSKVAPDEEIPWQIGIRTAENGTNNDYIGGAMFERPVKDGDHPVNGAVFIIVDKRTGEPKKMPPGNRISGTVPIDPLTSWMTTIPDKVEWVAYVGWLERTDSKRWDLHGTDKKNHTASVKKPPVPPVPEGAWDWIMGHKAETAVASSAGALALVYVAER